jgi:hypothetical protein
MRIAGIRALNLKNSTQILTFILFELELVGELSA